MRKTIMILLLFINVLIFGQENVSKFSWELPTYSEKYEITKSLTWIEPNWVVDNIFLFNTGRNSSDEDIRSFFTAISPRIFALDWGNASVIFGPFVAFEIVEVQADNVKTSIPINGALYPLSIDDIEITSQAVSSGISTLISFPEIGFQANLNLGYYVNHSKTRIDSYFLQDSVGVPPFLPAGTFDQIYQDYVYKQRTEGIFWFTEFYQNFDRNYLNYFRLRFLGYYQLEGSHTESSAKLTLGQGAAQSDGRVDIPTSLIEPNTGAVIPFNDLQSRVSNSTLYSLQLSGRLVTMPIPAIYEKDGISFDVIGVMNHIRTQHGYSLGVGPTIAFWSLVELTYTYSWQQDNNISDGWNVLLAVVI